jgi:hypothetical protein
MNIIPNTFNTEDWITYLNRDLTFKEQILFKKIKSEKLLNTCINKINDLIKHKNLEICSLTSLNGNCLFESLFKLGYGNNEDELRKSIAFLLYMYKDYNNFFNEQEDTLNTLFSNFNDIELVYSNNYCKTYNYTYDIMCIDLYESFNWTRLNTQLLLMFFSKFFNVNISIFHDNGFETNIHLAENSTKYIYLAHIDEMHYLPIKPILDINNLQKLEYNELNNEFISWSNDQINNKKN